MRIWTMSDLHLEGAVYNITDQDVFATIPDADVCVVAGDMANGKTEGSLRWLGHFIRPHMPVIYVLGNHDFYNDDMTLVRQTVVSAGARYGVHVLDDSSVTLGGVRFVGGTLWTDFDVYSKGDVRKRLLYMGAAREGMADFHAIDLKLGVERFQPEDALQLHTTTRSYLDWEMGRDFDGQTVVVTHHCPHPQSIADRFDQDPLTPAFASDLTWLMEKHQPALWIHGHTHDSFDYEVGETRIVCNPAGYDGENADFDPELVVDISRFGPRLSF